MSRLEHEERALRGRVPVPLRVIVNPVLLPRGAKTATFFEGCLSVAGYMALVERYDSVEVSGIDERGAEVRWTTSGWPARILQHEVDHLDGTLYVDRMLTRSLCSNDLADRWLHRPIEEVRAAFDLPRAPG
jgi:peptide deformylase